MDLGRGKEEYDVSRRFLQGFEQSVECPLAHHVDFVDDVDLESTLDRGITDFVD